MHCVKYWAKPLAIAAPLYGVLLLCGCQAPLTVRGTEVAIVSIPDGHTLEVQPQGMDPQRVRLAGVVAPDRDSAPWGEMAQRCLTALVGDGSVFLEFASATPDGCGQWRVYVWRDRLLVNEAAIARGCVLSSPEMPSVTPLESAAPANLTSALTSENAITHQRQFASAREWARLMGKGIWDAERPLRQTPKDSCQQSFQE